jgi:surface protein
MRSGSATITVNGTTVTSGRQFTITLGTNNTTSSVSATARGNRSTASGTVTFSNLVYTVEYSIPTYTVTFVDYDGTVLKTQTVEEGSSATAPADPSRAGYTFTGWDKSFSNITSNLTVSAQYTAIVFSNTNLRVKENGNWVPIHKVFQKVNGVWSDMSSYINSTFDTTFKYVNRTAPTAILYEDGALLLSNIQFVDNTHGNIIETYSNWDSADGSNAESWPWDADRSSIKTVYVTNPIVCKTNLRYMFQMCSNLTSLDLSNFDTSNVISMSAMFNGCRNLTSLDLSSFDTSNVDSMSSMFSGCSSLTSLDLSNFDTSNVKSMFSMFDGCSNLTSLDLSSFDTSNVVNTTYMFYQSTNPNLVIYVKDEATKTKIESSEGFPSTATVVIGKPN